MKTTGSKGVKGSRRRYTAAEKCRSVLALWTERSSSSELCRRLGVSWNQLSQWQEVALAGMLGALEPKPRVPGGNTPLSVRLQTLLARQAAAAARDPARPPGPIPMAPKTSKPGRSPAETSPRPPAPAPGAESAPAAP